MKRHITLWIAFASLSVSTVRGASEEIRNSTASSAIPLSFDQPSWSPNGRYLMLTDTQKNKIFIHDFEQGRMTEVVDTPSGGYAYNWSLDGRRIGFKILIPRNTSELPLQIPGVYDVDTQRWRALHAACERAGIPSFACDGTIAVTIDSDLLILDSNGTERVRHPLGHYANLAVISPDGTQVVFNGREENLWLMQVASGALTPLTDDGHYCHPQWSPDGEKVLARTISGEIAIVDIAHKTVFNIGAGSTPQWAPDSTQVIFTRAERQEGRQVVSSDIYGCRYDGTEARCLTTTHELLESNCSLSPDGMEVAFVEMEKGTLFRGSLVSKPLRTGHAAHGLSTKITGITDVTAIIPSDASKEVEIQPELLLSGTRNIEINPSASSTVLISGVPYIHQVYDTPNAFNGHWACNASAALMSICYYNKLSHWDCTVGVPYSHTSHFGRYVADNYSHNGHTYNIGSPDASNRMAYGGYGYIVRNDWKDTKGYMRDYIVNHGLTSSVDWSPTWSELQSEINAQHPPVVLNSLTSAGHYITVVGYYRNQHTGIFHDPYGNKNTTGYPSYDGAESRYDWPGYNNGYQNLNTVHCFIYCRGAVGKPDLTINGEVVCAPSSVVPGGTVRVNWTEENKGAVASGQTHNTRISLAQSEWGTNYLLAKHTATTFLNAGQTKAYAANFTVPTSIPVGNYYVTAYIDCDKQIAEENDNNNIGSSTPNQLAVLATYALSYNSNGATSGTAPKSQNKTHDVNLTLRMNSGHLARAGYTFEGWNTQANGLGSDYAAGGTYKPNASVTLYAKWRAVCEMDVQGNAVSIANGDNSPSLSDHTDFGTALMPNKIVVRTFMIRNTGAAALNLTATPKVVIGGANADDFTITTQPTSPVISGGMTTFQVTFHPSAAGERGAILSIANDDLVKAPYTFSITGQGKIQPFLFLVQ